MNSKTRPCIQVQSWWRDDLCVVQFFLRSLASGQQLRVIDETHQKACYSRRIYVLFYSDSFFCLVLHLETLPLRAPPFPLLLHTTRFLSGSTTRHPVRSNLTQPPSQSYRKLPPTIVTWGETPPSSPHTAYPRSAFVFSYPHYLTVCADYSKRYGQALVNIALL